MSIDEAIEVLHRIDKCNREHYDDCYGRCCEDCEYYYDDEELEKFSLQITEWLEELKDLREYQREV